MSLFERLKKKEEPEEAARLVPGKGRLPYPAYRGKDPYIFISYAHADSVRVFKEIAALNEAGYNVWYDEGIAPGNEWTDEIADALAECAVFVVMITPVSASRENVQNEINFALDEKKPFLAIHLEETTLRRGLKLQIGTKQAILKYNMTEDEYLFKLVDAMNRFGLKRKAVIKDEEPEQTTGSDVSMQAAYPQTAETTEEPKAAETKAEAPKATEASSEAPTESAPASTGYTLSPEALLRIEQAKNSEVRDIDFEWIGSVLKGFHGIQRRVTIPQRATRIMSHAFSPGLPMEQVVLHEGIKELDFAAFNKCKALREAVIEARDLKINDTGGIGAFYQCPDVKVWCHKGSATYEELKRTHTGEIRFIEDMQ